MSEIFGDAKLPLEVEGEKGRKWSERRGGNGVREGGGGGTQSVRLEKRREGAQNVRLEKRREGAQNVRLEKRRKRRVRRKEAEVDDGQKGR